MSAIGFGGSHFAKKALSEAQSIALVHAAIDRGITFMDNCWDYNDGQSEIRMGKALAQGGRRAKVFLETKIDGRTARKQIDESLRRLKTDHLDLLMHHEVLRFDDPDRIFAEGGAQEAVEAARKAGKVRFIGFTGQALAVTKGFQPLGRAELARLLQKTEQAAATGQYELFKTTAHFDGTAKHPDWLGDETPTVKSLAPKNAG